MMKNIKQILLNNAGISLVEVTIAMGISMMVTLGVMRTADFGLKANQKSTSELILKQWQAYSLQNAFIQEQGCEDNFTGGVGNLTNEGLIFESLENLNLNRGSSIPDLQGAWAIKDTTDAIKLKYDEAKSLCYLELQVVSKKLTLSIDKKISVPLECELNNDNEENVSLASCSLSSIEEPLVYTDYNWKENQENEYIYKAAKVLLGEVTDNETSGFEIDRPGETVFLFDSELDSDTEESLQLKLSVDIPSSQTALIFNQWGVYENESCSFFSEFDENLVANYKFCQNGIQLNSFNTDLISQDSAFNLGTEILQNPVSSYSFGKEIDSSLSNSFLWGRKIKADADFVNHIAFGFMKPDSTNRELKLNKSNYFNAAFLNGFHFITDANTEDRNVYITDNTEIAPYARVKLGLGKNIENIDVRDLTMTHKPSLYVNGDLVITDQAWSGDTGWIDFGTVSNSKWRPCDPEEAEGMWPQYRKINEVVYFRGCFKYRGNSSNYTNDVAFTGKRGFFTSMKDRVLISRDDDSSSSKFCNLKKNSNAFLFSIFATMATSSTKCWLDGVSISVDY